MKSQTFGEFIKTARLKQGYTLKKVAEQISINAAALSKVERNLQTAPETIIEPLAKTLQIDFRTLMVKYIIEKVYYNIKHLDYAKEAMEVVVKRLEKEGQGTIEVKPRAEILQAINHYFFSKPVEKAWIFGSFARNSNISFDSDIDILIQLKKPHNLTLFDLIEIKNELADKTGRAIDLVQKGTELTSFKDAIDKEKILVYKQQI